MWWSEINNFNNVGWLLKQCWRGVFVLRPIPVNIYVHVHSPSVRQCINFDLLIVTCLLFTDCRSTDLQSVSLWCSITQNGDVNVKPSAAVGMRDMRWGSIILQIGIFESTRILDSRKGEQNVTRLTNEYNLNLSTIYMLWNWR